MKKSRLPYYYLLTVIVILYIPILVAVICSFNASKMSSVWGGLSLTWYRTLFKDRAIRQALVNSLILAVSSSLLSALIATPAVLVFRKKNAFRAFIRGVSTIPIMIPDIILGMACLAWFRLLSLPFGMLTLLIAHTSFGIPHVFLQVASRVASMDDGPTEAARLLGAGRSRAFWDVTLPYLMPAVLSGMLIAFAMSFDDVIISMFVTGVTVNTLPVKVYSQVKTGMTPEINALCTLMLLVALLCIGGSKLLNKKTNKESEVPAK